MNEFSKKITDLKLLIDQYHKPDVGTRYDIDMIISKLEKLYDELSEEYLKSTEELNNAHEEISDLQEKHVW